MKFTVTVPNDLEEADLENYGKSVVIDQGGVDIIMPDGEVYSSNWGELGFLNVFGKVILTAIEEESSQREREMMLINLKHLVREVEKHV